MKTTPALLIVTADDFTVTENADLACDRLIQSAGIGEHRYGGKHYPGHHVVFKKWQVGKSWLATRALAKFI